MVFLQGDDKVHKNIYMLAMGWALITNLLENNLGEKNM